jgi:hypothetical protein
MTAVIRSGRAFIAAKKCASYLLNYKVEFRRLIFKVVSPRDAA